MMAIGGAFTTLSSEPSRLLYDREGSFSGISRRLLCRPLRQPRAGTPTSRRSPSTAGRRNLPHAPQSAPPKPHARALSKPAANNWPDRGVRSSRLLPPVLVGATPGPAESFALTAWDRAAGDLVYW